MTSFQALRLMPGAALLLLTLATAHAEPMGLADARHFLNRVGFGADPQMLADYARLSRSQAVTEALKPVSSATRKVPPADAAEFVPRSKMREMRRDSEEDKKAFQRDQQRRAALLRAWWLEEMLLAQTPAEQLRERMVLFWHNHFVSSIAKVRSSAVMLNQNQLFRRHALGDFGELLHAASKDPAMLVYLDSAMNRKGSPNENFAREVMELFTLGEGHYTEQDIKEAARAYTGWSVDPERGEFRWRPAFHDEGEKTVLGRRGNFKGDDVLDILLQQPQTAEFIVAKLWKEFVSPDPDAAEVKRIARAWRDGRKGYDIRVVMKLMLESKAFWADRNRGTLVKSPVDLVVGTLHLFEMNQTDGLPFALVVNQLGQDLFAPPNVKGWPGGEVWINSNTLLARKQFLDRLLRSDRRMGGPLRPVRAMNDEEPIRRRMRQALEDIHVDTSAWLREVDALRLKPEQVLLAVAPEPAKGDMDAGETLRRLMLDAAYQLK